MAVTLFIEMLIHSSVEPERRTCPSVFKAFSELGLARDGGQLHGRILKLGLQFDVYICNSLVYMYVNCGCFGETFELFRDGEDMDVVAWNSMILSLSKFGKIDYARNLLDEMPLRSCVSGTI
ncbi:hypothetical protein L6452_13642 [Arctium lappa]|uniref:Uncharacterized protein n=1 Tax=Arctium lappa TaxID=4217 RepID=A0ACB9CJ41_ARCLA|nr:hypothetical protein L6452_13642 [Arctium lappa]